MTSKDAIQMKRERLQDDLRFIQKQIYELEDNYISETSHYGNIVKGWDSYLGTTDIKAISSSRRPKVSEKERIFSSSSVNFVGDEELDGGLDEEEFDDLRDPKRKRTSMAPRRKYEDMFD